MVNRSRQNKSLGSFSVRISDLVTWHLKPSWLETKALQWQNKWTKNCDGPQHAAVKGKDAHIAPGNLFPTSS